MDDWEDDCAAEEDPDPDADPDADPDDDDDVDEDPQAATATRTAAHAARRPALIGLVIRSLLHSSAVECISQPLPPQRTLLLRPS
jgi:hypothetical protein